MKKWLWFVTNKEVYMNKYKFDAHIHTSETSPCGRIKGSEMVHLYKKAGYSGVIVTDHYHDGFFEALFDSNVSWEERVDCFYKGYLSAYNEGKKIGINVILGMEINFAPFDIDYLVYGVDEIFLKENEKLYYLNLGTFRELIKNKDILLYQAHPYRTPITPADPSLLDGVEVYNGNPRHVSGNKPAYEFAVKNKLKMISGSDFHEIGDTARGGILLPENIDNEKDLVQILKNDKIFGLIET
jgi:predicted metal-dependent phosphoesterase TrpH